LNQLLETFLMQRKSWSIFMSFVKSYVQYSNSNFNSLKKIENQTSALRYFIQN